MTIYLKQSTASQEVPLGHFVDDADGKTAETGLTINNTDIKIWKAGATTLANKNSGGATHIAGGVYYTVLDATDTDTLGSLVIFCQVSGALPVRLECVVLAANIYDSMIGGGDVLDVSVTQLAGSAIDQSGGLINANVKQISTDATAADNAEAFFDGTGYAGTNNVIPTVTNVTNQVAANVTAISGDTTAADNLEAAADGTGYNLGGGQVVAASVTGAAGSVTGSVGSVAAGGISAASFAAGAIDAAAIAANAIGASELAADAVAEIADGVWDEARSGHSASGTYGESFFGLESGEAVTGTLSTTQMSTNLTEATDDHYNGRVIVWLTGVLTRQATAITDYNGTTKVLTFTAVTEAPGNGDRFVIV